MFLARPSSYTRGCLRAIIHDRRVGAVTQEVFRQIAAGASEVSVSPLLRKHAKKKENGGTEGHGGDESVARDRGQSSSGLTQDIGALAMGAR